MKLSTQIILMCVALMFSAGGAFALPKCKGSYSSSTWTDCSGQHTFATEYHPIFFKDGKEYQGDFSKGDTYSGDWGHAPGKSTVLINLST